MNEILTSTTLQDAIVLSEKVMGKIIELNAWCVWVSFIDELASFGEQTVSMVSTIVPENPTVRTYKVIRKELDDDYFYSVQDHLREFKFRGGVLLSAELGKGNKGTDCVLRKPAEDKRTRRLGNCKADSSALLEKRIKVFFVTNLYELAHGFVDQKMENAIFLRAERQADGQRTFKLVEGEPLQTSFGEDVYKTIIWRSGKPPTD